MADYTTVEMDVRSLLADILRTGVPPAGTLAWGWVDDNGALVSVPLADMSAVAAPATPGTVIDLLDLTGSQMDEVIALTYLNHDADPADSPTWSYPGQFFDAVDLGTGGNYHYYCSRGTYVPGDSTTGAGPAWHRIEKF